MSEQLNDIKRKHPSIEKIEKFNSIADKLDSRKLKTTLSIDTVKRNLPNINVMNTQIITNSVEVKKVDYDTLSDREILAVKKHNVDNFYKQIMNNLVIGAKSVFLVCRDLSDAQKELSTEDFEVLKQTLPLTNSTICKYLKVGKSTTCRELFSLNRLPESWTTMYKISTLKDDDKNKILNKVDIKTTAQDIDIFLGVMKKELAPIWNFNELESPKVFLQIAVENDSKIADIDPNALKLISKKVQKVISDTLREMDFKTLKYNVSKNEKPFKVEVAENKTFIEKVEEKVLNYFNSLKGKDVKNDYFTAYKAKELEIINPVLAKLGN
jgi:DNA-binding protein Fis